MPAQPVFQEIHGEQGPWLVFLPGLTCAASDWQPQNDALKDQYRCVAVDLRGHGQSSHLPGPLSVERDAEDLAELLEKIDARDAILVGHSRGVRVAALSSLRSPERVAGLVFVDGSQQGTDPSEARKAVMATIDAHPDVPTFIRTMFADMFLPDTPHAVSAPIIDRAAAMDPARFRELIGDMVTWDAAQMPDVFRRISTPVTLVQSTVMGPDRVRRPLTDNETSPFIELVRESIPAARIDIVAGVGHFTQIDAPDRVTRAIQTMCTQI